MAGKQPVTFNLPYELYVWLKSTGNQTRTVVEALEREKHRRGEDIPTE